MKFIVIIIFSFLFIGNVFSTDELNTKSLMTSSHQLDRSIVNDLWLEDKTVSDLVLYGFKFGNPSITVSNNNVQFHLLKLLPDEKFVYIICFVDIGKTTCRLP